MISDCNKITEVINIQKIKTLVLKDLLKQHNFKDDTLNEFDLKRVYSYSIYPTGSKTTTDKGFKYIDNGSMGGTHWTCFYIKDNKLFYFDSFGAQLDNFLPNQLPEPITYHNYENQDINSKL